MAHQPGRALRILLANLDYIPYRSSGLAVYGEILATGLAARGHDVTVVTRHRPGAPRQERIGGVDVYRVGLGRGDWIEFAWAAAPAVARLRVALRPDIVHFADVHFAWRYHGPFVASLHQSFRQRLTSDDGHPYHVGGGLGLRAKTLYYRASLAWAERPALARAQHLISVSQATADAFIQGYGVPRERVTVIPTGIDLAHLTRVDPSPLRRKLGLTDERVLLFVGFASPRKGLEYLAQAMRSLPADVRLVVVGRWQPGYRQRVLEALGPARGRLIEAGYVSDEELPAYYSLADILVLPSLLEGFGIPIIEALACGVPVVTTSAGASAETGGPGARVVPPRDAAALAGALGQLLASPGERQRLGAAGRAWARQRFSREAMIAAYEQVYRSLAPR